MIRNIASHLPATVLSNDELARIYPGWSAEKIWEKTGIRERRIVKEGECASDLAFGAAERLLASGTREIDYLLFCTELLSIGV